MAMIGSSWENRCISASGTISQAAKNSSEISPLQRSIRLKIFCSVILSPLPQYWAPRMAPAAVAAMMNMFCTNWICVASDTAVI